MVLLQTILLYLLAALVLPDVGGDQRIDLRDHYFSQAPWFFGFGLALLVVSVVKDLIVTGDWPARTNTGVSRRVLCGLGGRRRDEVGMAASGCPGS